MNWADFEKSAPALAAYGRHRLHGRVSYLATVRHDGSPRVHPVTPLIGGGGLWIFMQPTSPKVKDLKRDGRYSLHCGVEDRTGGGGEIAISGSAVFIGDTSTRARAAEAAMFATETLVLFAFSIEDVRVTRYGPGGEPKRERWPAA